MNLSTNTHKEKKAICECCGNEFTLPEQAKGGRPKIYCSPECRNLVKYINAFENLTEKINFTERSSKIFRGDLFAIANNLYNKNKKEAQ